MLRFNLCEKAWNTSKYHFFWRFLRVCKIKDILGVMPIIAELARLARRIRWPWPLLWDGGSSFLDMGHPPTTHPSSTHTKSSRHLCWSLRSCKSQTNCQIELLGCSLLDTTGLPPKALRQVRRKKQELFVPEYAPYIPYSVFVYVFGDWREGFYFFKKVSQTELDFRNFHGQQVAFFCIFSWPNTFSVF